MEHAGSIYVDMIGKLKSHGIDYLAWFKKPGAKSFLDLFQELQTGESLLIEEGEILKRIVKVAYVDVFASAGDHVVRLVEKQQIMAGGKIRTRNLSTSIGEKLEPDETPQEAALRGLEEELGVTVGVDGLEFMEEGVTTADSQSYPGLLTDRHFWEFMIMLDESMYKQNPMGFVEENDRGTRTEFVWQEVLPE